MRRVSVVGTSGSGKTTLSRKLAAALDVPMLELDGVFHQPDWTPLPVEDFRHTVTEFVTGSDGWVVDGNYSAVRDLVWARADTVVWFDLPRYEVMRRLSWRTARRGTYPCRLEWESRVAAQLPASRSRKVDPGLGLDHASSQPRSVPCGRSGSAWSHMEFVRIASAKDIRSLLSRTLASAT